MAMAAMTESMLLDDHMVKTVCMSTHKHPYDASKIDSNILLRTNMESLEMDTHIKPFQALANIFGNTSYNVVRFYSEEFDSRLTSILQNESFDIVHLESTFCTPYLETIRKHSKAKVVVRTHNVEFKIWNQLADQEKNPLKKWYLRLLTDRLQSYETSILTKVDGIISITQEDKVEFEKMGIKCPIEVIPIGYEVVKTSPKRLQTDKLKLYHVAAMDWLPNIEGVNWFLQSIWGKIEHRFPNVDCFLAGRNMPSSLLSQAKKNLHIEGEIKSMEDYVSDKNIALVPLLSGSGMRVKIVEALALGKVVISTTIGAQGIPYEDGKNMLIANTPQDFVEKLEFLTNNPDSIRSIGENARKLAIEKFDLHQLSTKLTYFYAHKL